MPVVTQNTTAMTSVMVLDTLTAWAIRAAGEVTITTAFTAAAPPSLPSFLEAPAPQ